MDVDAKNGLIQLHIVDLIVSAIHDGVDVNIEVNEDHINLKFLLNLMDSHTLVLAKGRLIATFNKAEWTTRLPGSINVTEMVDKILLKRVSDIHFGDGVYWGENPSFMTRATKIDDKLRHGENVKILNGLLVIDKLIKRFDNVALLASIDNLYIYEQEMLSDHNGTSESFVLIPQQQLTNLIYAEYHSRLNSKEELMLGTNVFWFDSETVDEHDIETFKDFLNNHVVVQVIDTPDRQRWNKLLRKLDLPTLELALDRVQLMEEHMPGTLSKFGGLQKDFEKDMSYVISLRKLGDSIRQFGMDVTEYDLNKVVWIDTMLLTTAYHIYLIDNGNLIGLKRMFLHSKVEVTGKLKDRVTVLTDVTFDEFGCLKTYSNVDYIDGLLAHFETAQSLKSLSSLDLGLGNGESGLGAYYKEQIVPSTIQPEMKFKPFSGVVIDTETLGVAVDSVVIEIGVVIFSTTEILEKRSFQLPITPQMKAGLIADPGTVAWWFDTNLKSLQDTAGERSAVGLTEKFSIEQVLLEINDFIISSFQEHLFHIDDRRIFTCGTDFDIPILRNLYKTFGVKAVFLERFRAVRDWRTLAEHFMLHKNDFARPFNSHRGLDDALNEVNFILDLNKILMRACEVKLSN